MTSTEILQNIKIDNYNNVGSLTFFAWDLCITAGDEVEQIWGRPWSFLKFLYFALRYHTLTVLLSFHVLSLMFEAGFAISNRSCYIWLGFQAYSTELLQMGTQILLIRRLYALYDNIAIRRLLAFLFCAELITVSVIFCLEFRNLEIGERCTVTRTPIVGIVFLLWPPVFESLLFGLTMMKFYVALRDDGWGRQTVMTRFLQDGIWAFALPFISSTVNTCCMFLLTGFDSTAAYGWVTAISGFVGYRLILNTSHLLRTTNRREVTSFPDTLPVTFDGDTMYSISAFKINFQDQDQNRSASRQA